MNDSGVALPDSEPLAAALDLGAALRELIEVSVTTTVPPGEVRAAADLVRQVTERLAVARRPASQLSALDDPSSGRRVFNPVSGLGNAMAPPLRLHGPVTRADGGKNGIGKGYGGARIDLEKLSTTDPHSRQLLAAQIIWTLARADIRGPYVINADGAPLDDRFRDGWTTSDVAATDPGPHAERRRFQMRHRIGDDGEPGGKLGDFDSHQ